MKDWRPSRRVIIVSLTALLGLLCVIGGCAFLVGGLVRLRGESILMSGPSLEPTIQPGKVMALQPFGSTGPQRGDIVVLHPPIDPSVLYVKRVIALPGDTIAIDDVGVRVNNRLLAEPYVAPQNWLDRTPLAAMTMRSGQYFVMGDNRDNSIDSRMFGAIDRSSIVGKLTPDRPALIGGQPL